MPQEECKEKILSEEYRDFMMRDTGALGENFPLENGCRIPLKYGFELLYIDQSEDRKKPLGDYPYTMVPKCYTTLDMAAIQQAGIAAVQNLTGLELSGEGVLVGIIDTGINYLDPIFRNLDGSTRIRRIWDQEEQSGTAPREMEVNIRGNKSIWRSRARIQRKPFRHLIRTDMALLLQVWHAEGQIRRICLSGQRRRQRW
jgi:hypothetical protein